MVDLKHPCWPRAAASAAVFRGGAVLLVERSKPPQRWSLPGGHIEPGERAIEAARREVLEETGVDAEIRGLIDVHDVLLRDSGVLQAHYVLAVFHGRWLRGEPCAASDVSDARFVPLERVADLALTPGALALIRRAAELAATDPAQPT